MEKDTIRRGGRGESSPQEEGSYTDEGQEPHVQMSTDRSSSDVKVEGSLWFGWTSHWRSPSLEQWAFFTLEWWTHKVMPETV